MLRFALRGRAITRSPTMKIQSIIAALLAAVFVFTGSSVIAKDPPAFPGQPHLNAALKHLTAAKEKVATDATASLGDLESAKGDLSHAIHNKGTYQTIARQLTEQAKQYLEKGDVDKATHKIDEAIQNVNRAGQTGDH
jgi:VIT1/CCC1 family predicted Fe2+/Mn2+ transporter